MSQILRPIARNSNLTNSQNGNPRSVLGKSSIYLKTIIPPGQTLPMQGSGNRFRVVVATSEVRIRPTGDLVGVSNPYYGATGLNLAETPQEVFTDAEGKLLVNPAILNSFSMLELFNPSETKSLYIEIISGWDDYIDVRFSLPASQFSQVPVVLYDAYHPVEFGGAQTFLAMPDLSGTIITDPNGTEWFAANRSLVLIMNNDVSNYTIITNADQSIFVTMAHPLTTSQFTLTGLDLGIQMADGGNIGGIITEVYNAVPVPS